MHSVKYIGCFIERSVIEKYAQLQGGQRLSRVIGHPHVTFCYKPQSVPYEFFGQEVKLRVVGYGCDGMNEAFLVEFESVPQNLLPLTKAITTPHVTISVSDTAEPVNSKYIHFRPIESFTVSAVFGAMDTDGNLHTQNSAV